MTTSKILVEKKVKTSSKVLAEKDAELLINAFEELGVSDFVKYLRSPWIIMWHNFLAGIFRGLGIIVGMTLVFAFLIWLLTNLVNFPLLGQYFLDMKEILEAFSIVQTLAQ